MIPLTIIFLIIFLCIITPSIQSNKVSIFITPTILKNSGDSIQIKWSNIDSPSDLDWLGIYSPPHSQNDNFIGYMLLNKSPTWQSGYGSISLPLINLRSNYSFRIFHWPSSEINTKHHDHDHNPLPSTKHLLVSSKEVAFENGLGPEQVHLGFGDREDEMRVVFVSGDVRESYVRYGESEGGLDCVVVARVRRYEREHMCDSPANETVGWRDPGFIHHGVMTNLKNGVRYYYQVGSDSIGWSTIHSFVSRNNESDETIAFLFGDMGTATPYSTFVRTQDESISTMKWILRDIEALGDKPAFVSHIGDISYARGYAWLWDNFFTQIEPVASKVAYHVCIGNHEYDWPLQPWKPYCAAYGKDGGGECGVPYSLRFNMPGNSSEPTGTEAPATRNLYYSFDMGVVHFVYFSTETNFLPGSSQYNFLKHDLESVNRSKTPFVVVQGHRPMYTTSYENRDAPLKRQMLEHLEPLLVNNNVTLALWGHVHRYERFCALNNSTCISPGENGTVHAVIGMAGQDWQSIWQPRENHPDMPVFPQPKQSLYRGGEFGYTRLVANREKLVLSYVGNHDGNVHDMVKIFAPREGINDVSGVNAGKDGNQVVKSNVSWYVEGASVMLIGTIIGFIIGYFTRGRKKSENKTEWTLVKTEER